MAGSSTEETGVGRSVDFVSNGQQQCQTSEALAEWRSSEQVENGSPSTSPPYWDIDDDDGGPKPSELYGKYTWKIDKFSQINKRELRSNAFEVGGYKWYILIYPQGCDVCNHLSLFLCVANHDKLLPGWSHFAQFTISVVNKDVKKSKYSDTLHRFWKKEHDWGWKKFMELSKVLDGFIDADTLIIKAQVQVIRERVDGPFRCLDCQYRRELVRVYLTNVEQICRRFVEEHRGKLGKLIEDKARWPSFCAFWSGMDPTAKRRMTCEKTESILRVVVKHFFIEKEVTSTLVMDSLYSGLKALEGQTKSKNDKGKLNVAEEVPAPVVCMEKDMFVLVDDVLQLLQRVALEPLPPKDEKGPQNRTKDGSSGEDFNKDSIERDERRLTELGRRTIETFVLSHIFSSKIEVAYQDAVALKRQEELIREEEEEWMIASEQKPKRGASEKEKKSKKKQGKQKKNNRKSKDKGRSEKSSLSVQDNIEPESPISEREEYLAEEAVLVNVKAGALEDTSDLSDSLDCLSEVLQPESEDRDASPVSWATDTSELNPPIELSSSRVISYSAVQNGLGSRTPVLDDSSSTCSTDSIPSVVTNGHWKGDNKSQKSTHRGRKQQGKATPVQQGSARGILNGSSERSPDVGKLNASQSYMTCGSQATISSSNENGKTGDQRMAKGEDPQKRKAKVEAVTGRPSQEKNVPPSPRSTSKAPASMAQSRSERKITSGTDHHIPAKKQVPSPDQDTDRLKQDTESAQLMDPSETGNLVNRSATVKPLEKLSAPVMPAKTEKASASQISDTTQKPEIPQFPIMSRPQSAPLAPEPRPIAPVVSIVQSTPLLARSVSAAGRLGPETSTTSQSYIPQSYRNAMMGNRGAGVSSVYPQPQSPSSSMSSSHSYTQSPAQAPIFLPQSSERMESNSIRPSFSFGMLNHDLSGNGKQWSDNYPSNSALSIPSDHPSLFRDIRNFDNHQSNSGRILSSGRPSVLSEIRNFDVYNPVHLRSPGNLPSEFPAGTSGHQSNATMTDEFPHLDIINDLLDDDLGMETGTSTSSSFQSFSNGPQHLNRQYSFPGEIGMLNDIAPPMSSYRFERTQSYQEDGHPREYVFPGGPTDSVRDMLHHSNSSPGPYPDQWLMASSNDLSFLDENGSYAYHMPDYSNLPCGINGYGVFRPSSGF
ncbi:hypothetical protein LIER_13227 [Lithospermum erythrorhizon]|uniref:MATH domain-containing protein n=1 Tax=Lithospermum erythrorhizon TaxID=34254 RepID=A0AAV3PZX5_LITER